MSEAPEPTTQNPLTAEQVATAADVCDAVDPALPIDQRIAAGDRAARRDAKFALLVATQLLSGAIDATPNPQTTMTRLRAHMSNGLSDA
ncbi:hypothetical protein AB0K35_28175 [Micromonospora sp. NPDC053740]|uniref:hypothetical protein n=1 Tax=Micromonospora sp. NPDC053740 TaxID=3155173 RepID=UPI00341917C5